jgi:hypothetical protein
MKRLQSLLFPTFTVPSHFIWLSSINWCYFLFFVSFRYFLEDTEANSRAYLEKQHITASDEVRQLAADASRLIETCTSKM